MSFTSEIIQKATKCNKSEISEIENFMRNNIFHSTLDWQTKPQLIKAAKEAKECLDFMKTDEGKKYLSNLSKEMMI